jgi:hypothetical protein
VEKHIWLQLELNWHYDKLDKVQPEVISSRLVLKKEKSVGLTSAVTSTS